MSARDVVVAVAGATGAVGREMLKTLEQRDFPASKVIPLASSRSAGKRVPFKGDELVEVTPHHLRMRKILLDPMDRKRSGNSGDDE